MSHLGVSLTVLLALASACGEEPGPRLDLLLLTDYRPGIDFASVQVDVVDEAISSRAVGRDESFLEPGDVARFEALPKATRRRVQVSLFDDDGALLQRSRTVSFRHEVPRQQVSRICAACEEFACPLGQTCECGVFPMCVPDECDEECEASLRCNTDADCGESPSPCLSLTCESGTCLRVPDDDVCGDTQICDVGSGCIQDGERPLEVRQIAPMSTSTVTSRRPTLRWELSAASDGASVELCRDRAMTSGCLAPLDVTGSEVRPPSELAPGWWYFRLRARVAGLLQSPGPVWQFRVGTRSADGDVDTSWGTEPDIDGDGFADVVVGSPDADVAGAFRGGSVSIYRGSSSGLETSPSQVLEGTTSSGNLGFAVASAGDVNGDGFVDVIVGAPGAGTVSLYLGSARGLARSPRVVLEGAFGDDFGATVASAGDVNGDGYSDVLIGAPRASPGGRGGAGMVVLHLGSPAGLLEAPSRVLEGVAAGDNFGVAIASAGNFDGDGYSDVVIGADRAGTLNAGSVSVYMGSLDGISATPTHRLEGSTLGGLGASVANAGDVDGDGYADLIVGAPDDLTTGRVFLYRGSSTGLNTTASPLSMGTLFDDFGASVASAGDVNSDGYADVVVGAPTYMNGRATLFLGSSAGVPDMAEVLAGDRVNGQFGRLVASVGDVDGDGHPELAIAGRTVTGRWGVSVFRGSPTGLETSPTVLEGSTLSDRFGWSVARAQ